MDALDKAFLFELSMNCRISYTVLAEKYHVSINTVKNRIKKLTDDSIIKQFVVQLNPALFSASIAIIIFHCTDTISADIIQQLGSHGSVEAVGLGTRSGFLVAYYRTNKELEDITEFLHSLKWIKSFDVYPVLPPLTVTSNSTQEGGLNEIQGVDWLLLYHLRFNGRLPISELAKRTRLSAKTIRKRLEYLRKRHIILESIQMNPGAVQKGLMVIYKVDLSVLTAYMRREVEKQLLKEPDVNFWVSWKVVDRPILLLGFQVDNANEVLAVEKKIVHLLPDYRTIDSFIGGSMEYFTDFRDEILEEKRNTGWFSPELWDRKR